MTSNKSTNTLLLELKFGRTRFQEYILGGCYTVDVSSDTLDDTLLSSKVGCIS